jgi:hypothetical protein
MEVKSRCSFLGCGCTGQISLGSHRAEGGGELTLLVLRRLAFLRVERDIARLGRQTGRCT